MKLIVISGRSGSGKSTALQALEDIGYYCIDNLPAMLLTELVNHMQAAIPLQQHLAICIDARNLASHLEKLPHIWPQIASTPGISLELLYLDAAEATLIKRYSASRRRHPMIEHTASLQDAIASEKNLLEPVANLADIRIDTTRLSIYELRDIIKLRIAERREQTLSLQFQSFGFKHGVPLDADLVFDMRILPNPYWVTELRQFTGLDAEVQTFLGQHTDVQQMIEDIRAYLQKWLPHFSRNNRSYVTVAIGCTGGQHRSVYVVEQLAGYFKHAMDNVSTRHRELP